MKKVLVNRNSFVAKNERCIKCGFPNYDFQVLKTNRLCRECDKEYEIKLINKE